MADENEHEHEEKFFSLPPPPDTSETDPKPVVEPVKPMSLAMKVAAGLAVIAFAIGAFFALRPKHEGVLWIMNPGPGRVDVTIGRASHTVDEGVVLDLRVPASPEVEVIAKRGDVEERRTVDVAPLADGVTILDFGADAAYVIADVSTHYKTPAEDKLEILDVSPPADVHYLTYPATALVRPGAPLPNRDSWELQVAPKGQDGIQVHKVFRIRPDRLDDKDKLITLLTQAMSARVVSDSENMTVGGR